MFDSILPNERDNWVILMKKVVSDGFYLSNKYIYVNFYYIAIANHICKLNERIMVYFFKGFVHHMYVDLAKLFNSRQLGKRAGGGIAQ